MLSGIIYTHAAFLLFVFLDVSSQLSNWIMILCMFYMNMAALLCELTCELLLEVFVWILLRIGCIRMVSLYSLLGRFSYDL